MIFGYGVFFCIYEVEKCDVLKTCPRSVNNSRTKNVGDILGMFGPLTPTTWYKQKCPAI